MGWWQIDADTLAGSRFVLSPLAETTAGLMRLRWDTADHPVEREWLREHRAAYAARLAADPVTAALVVAALRPRWAADFLTPAPAETERTFEQEVAVVRATPPARAREDLAYAGPRPAELDRDDLGDRAADLLTWIWQRMVEADWPRRRRILEADVISRTRQLTLGGWEAALARMRGGMSWLGQGRLQINAYDYPPLDISATRLLFVPVTMTRGWVAVAERRHAVIYPCAGLLAEPERVAPGALGRLLGPVRARVLASLDVPRSTSQLVAITGAGLGSVGRHLRILLEAGLVMRRRAGRSVLYARTPEGDGVVRAASSALRPRPHCALDPRVEPASSPSSPRSAR